MREILLMSGVASHGTLGYMHLSDSAFLWVNAELALFLYSHGQH